MINPLFREHLVLRLCVSQHNLDNALLPFGYSLSVYFGCLSVTELKDTSLLLPIGVLLAGNQIRLPVRTAFIPASEIDDHSLLWGKCFCPQHLGRETWVCEMTNLNPCYRSSRTLTDIQLSWFCLAYHKGFSLYHVSSPRTTN